MKAIIKRLLIMTLAVGMILATLPLSIIQADESDFVIVDGVLTEYTGSGGDIVVPDGVTEIGTDVFRGNDDITSVVLPSSVTVIHDSAFRSCNNLVTINFPEGITSIGISCFQDCTSLEEVSLPNSLLILSKNLFYGCTNLQTVVLPNSLDTIGRLTFSDCISIVELTLPESVTTILGGAFYRCTGLQSIDIPDNVKTIEAYTFGYCEDLAIVNLPESLETINEYAFWHCSSLTSIDLPDTLNSLSWGVFARCASLNNVIIPDSLTALDGGTFEYCSELTDITLPETLETLFIDSFSGCVKLTKLTIPSSVTAIAFTLEECPASIYCYPDSYAMTYAIDTGINYYTLPLEADNIAINTVPNKIAYQDGEDLIPDGGKLDVVYVDSSSEIIDITLSMLSGYDSHLIGTQTVTVTYRESTTTFEVTVTAVEVNSIVVNSLESNLILNENMQMETTIDPSNATDQSVTWSVINGTGSATIDQNGLLSATGVGTVTVRATANDGSDVYGEKEIVVTPLVSSITVNSDSNTVLRTETLQMSADILPIDAEDQTVTWSVINGTGSATIGENGLLTATGAGTVTVRATANDGSGVYGEKEIVVTPLVSSITVNSDSNTVLRTETLQMSADILPIDAEDQTVTWSVINGTGSATIGENGLLTATGAGTVTVRATANDGSSVYGEKEITVEPIKVSSITVSSDSDTVLKTDTLQMSADILPINADDQSVTWSVINGTGSATIGENGLLTATGAGTVTVRATANDGSSVYGEKEITVEPIKVSSITVSSDSDTVLKTDTLQMSADILPINADDQSVTWSVTNGTGSATIGENGLLTATDEGTVTVRATANDGSDVYGEKEIVVTPLVSSITVNSDSNTVLRTETLQMSADILPINADDQSVTWSVINGTGSATIGENGLLTATGAGTVTVRATANDGSSVYGEKEITVEPIKVSSITVSSDSDTVLKTDTLQMSADILPINADDQSVTWSVTNGTGSATIGENGLLTATDEGTVTVRATANDGSDVYGEKEIVVTPLVSSITVNSDSNTVLRTETLQMSADILPINADDQSVTWSVINGTGSATIGENGLLTATGAGTVTVRATANDGSSVYGEKEITIGIHKGAGTEELPYLVYTKEDLNSVRYDLSAYYKLMNDIEFADADFESGGTYYNDGAGFVPIGAYVTPFTGTFDGNGYTIANLYVYSTVTENSNIYAGLFGVSSGTIQNLGVEGGSITAYTATDYIDAYAGGIVALQLNGTIAGCHNSNNVMAKAFVNEYAGGIVGYQDDGLVTQSFNTGKIEVALESYFDGSYYDALLISEQDNVYYDWAYGATGGIVGYSKGNITECYNAGLITTPFVGQFKSDCFGGITAVNDSGTISNCYNIGSIMFNFMRGEMGKVYAGGISALNQGTITDSYHAGDINYGENGNNDFDWVASFVGKNDGTIDSGYYIDTFDIGIDGGTTAGVTMLTSTQMENQSSFVGLDFTDNWTMDGSASYLYPELRSILLFVSSISVDSDSDTVRRTETLQMSADILPIDAKDQTVTWRVINGTGSATIDENGLLTATGVGTVTVRATANDGSRVYGEKIIEICESAFVIIDGVLADYNGPGEDEDSQVKLNWAPAAMYYKVYLYDGTYNALDSTTDTSYTIAGLINGQIYRYLVRAVIRQMIWLRLSRLHHRAYRSMPIRAR